MSNNIAFIFFYIPDSLWIFFMNIPQLTKQIQDLSMRPPQLGDMNFEHERTSLGILSAFIEFTMLEWVI